jgi:hypothetical protein
MQNYPCAALQDDEDDSGFDEDEEDAGEDDEEEDDDVSCDVVCNHSAIIPATRVLILNPSLNCTPSCICYEMKDDDDDDDANDAGHKRKAGDDDVSPAKKARS